MALPYITAAKVEQLVQENNNVYYVDLKDTELNVDSVASQDITELVNIEEFKNAISENKLFIFKNVVMGAETDEEWHFKAITSQYCYVEKVTDSSVEPSVTVDVYGVAFCVAMTSAYHTYGWLNVGVNVVYFPEGVGELGGHVIMTFTPPNID